MVSGKTGKYKLKYNLTCKADIWKQFPLLHEVDEGDEKHVKYYCACSKCFKVYQYKDPNGKNFGTKNMLEHTNRCVGSIVSIQSQPKLDQCFKHKVQLAKADTHKLKRQAVEYCVDGYQSFKSVEHTGLIRMLQTCVELGAKYGNFDITTEMVKRNTVSREVHSLASHFKLLLATRLKDSVHDGTVSLCIDMYTDDYRKKSYLDIHASWIDRDFSFHHAALAVRHFGTLAHTGRLC